MGTDTENDTRHPGQEEWNCAESIHTEWGQIPRMTPGIRDRSGTVHGPGLVIEGSDGGHSPWCLYLGQSDLLSVCLYIYIYYKH
ncbi:unnamed protein product [Staurois parvus]|uniref:Uncharacterized protein n=1 Tax=Staurois parvus TaxID=386267 RepID=A0ABN9GHU6_9NEOB|nr:unnamed protein product [Staurois parvus]